MLVYGQGNTAQAEMKIRGPAAADFPGRHQVQANCIGQCQVLVRESSQQLECGHLIPICDRHELESTQGFDEAQKLERAKTIVAAKKPSMAFGNDQRRRNQRRRIREESAKQRMMR